MCRALSCCLHFLFVELVANNYLGLWRALVLIREIILDNEKLIITYNFTDNNLPKKAIPDNLDEVVETAKAVVDNSSNVLDSVPPPINSTKCVNSWIKYAVNNSVKMSVTLFSENHQIIKNYLLRQQQQQ